MNELRTVLFGTKEAYEKYIKATSNIFTVRYLVCDCKCGEQKEVCVSTNINHVDVEVLIFCEECYKNTPFPHQRKTKEAKEKFKNIFPYPNV